MLQYFHICKSKSIHFFKGEKKECGMSFENQVLFSNHASIIPVALHSAVLGCQRLGRLTESRSGMLKSSRSDTMLPLRLERLK